MTFAPHDAAAMLSDFGSVVVCGTVRTVGVLDRMMMTSDDGSGFPVQRAQMVLRLMAGTLGEWKRDDVVTIGAVRYRLRELVDDPRVMDGVHEMISVGRA